MWWTKGWGCRARRSWRRGLRRRLRSFPRGDFGRLRRVLVWSWWCSCLRWERNLGLRASLPFRDAAETGRPPAENEMQILGIDFDESPSA